MLAWRCAIVAASLAQLVAGVACWCLALDSDVGRFGLAACVAVGALGLVGQGTTSLRPAAVGANALLALVFLPGLLGRIVLRLILWADPASVPPGADMGVVVDLVAAGMVTAGAASALGLWRLSAGGATGPADPGAAPDRGGMS